MSLSRGGLDGLGVLSSILLHALPKASSTTIVVRRPSFNPIELSQFLLDPALSAQFHVIERQDVAPILGFLPPTQAQSGGHRTDRTGPSEPTDQ